MMQAGRSHSARQNAFFRLFQKRNHLLTRNCWEILKKLIDRIAALQVIHKILNRHTRPGKTRCAAHNLWIDFDDRLAHVSQFSCETARRASPSKEERLSAIGEQFDALVNFLIS